MVSGNYESGEYSMSTKQDLEEIKLRAKRECANLRTSMKERGCPENEIEKRCREITQRAEGRVAEMSERTRIK